MDFMRVFDQTIREIKREVNLRVLKVPEIEQKVLDATSDEPWGPHGSALAEIAQETKKIAERQMIMNVLWERLSETGSNWRYVYKALTVIEYLLANGSERTVDDIIEHSFQISSLSGFHYVEPKGKDMGINVRKKAETLLALINDSGRIKRVRERAAATRNKYFGVSSNGITYKSGSALISNSSFGVSHGRFGSSKSQGNLADTYKELNKPSKGITRHCSSSKPSYHLSSTTQENDDDDLEDFDPRAGSAPVSVRQANLLGDSMVACEPLDAPASGPLELVLSTYGSTAEVDLFADVDGAVPVESNSHLQDNNYGSDLFGNNQLASFTTQMDLLDSQISQANSFESFDLFASKPDPEMDLVKSDNLDVFATKPCFDPFGSLEPYPQAQSQSQAQADMTDNLDPFGDAKFHQPDGFDNPLAIVPLNASKQRDLLYTELIANGKQEIALNSGNNSNGDQYQRSKDNNFQIKSGIWADSLSRGLIDLNITTPVESTLVDIGILSGLGGDAPKSNDKDKGIPSSSLHMGRAMGTGTGLGISSLSSMGAVDGESTSNTGSFFK